MEFESKTGSKIRLQEPSKTIDLGRGLGFDSTDRTVSRRHIAFKLHEDRTRVYFEVKGKNPIWVRDHENDEIRVYRSSECGEIKSGDSFCVSSKHPVWFNLKRIACEDEYADESKSEIGYDEAFAEISGVEYDEIETGDLSHIDPVKEFNFVVMGHEFDCYPKKMMRDLRNWDWFLEEAKADSDEDEISDKKGGKGIRKKRKKGKRGEEDDDDVWTGESEEDAELIKKLRNDPKPKYSTRSKKQERNKKGKGASASKSGKDIAKRDEMDDDEEEDDDDENDETLGGFIVEDEDVVEGNDEEDEEEEFEEDEDDE